MAQIKRLIFHSLPVAVAKSVPHPSPMSVHTLWDIAMQRIPDSAKYSNVRSFEYACGSICCSNRKNITSLKQQLAKAG